MLRLAYWYRAWYARSPFSAYLYTKSASTLHTLHLIMFGDMLFLPSSRRPFFPLVGSLCEYRARARQLTYTHNSSEANGCKFLHAICRAAAYFGARRRSSFCRMYVSATETRRRPLIWKYSVTVIKDALDWALSPFRWSSEESSKLSTIVIGYRARNEFIRE